MTGRLTADPEVRYTNGENSIAVANYTLAIDRPKREGQEQTADFPRCIAFGKAAEFAEKYLHKGSKILVEGRIQTGSYTNKDNQKVYTTDVVIEHQEFAESKGTAQTAQKPQEEASNQEWVDIPEDGDLPFLPPTR